MTFVIWRETNNVTKIETFLQLFQYDALGFGSTSECSIMYYILYSLYSIFLVLGFLEMSLFLAWTILLNYFLSKFFAVSLRFMCLVFVQDIEELFFIVVLLGTMFGT